MDGHVAVAALEPTFAAALCAAAGLPVSDAESLQTSATRDTITRFLKKQTRQQLDVLAASKDIPLHTMA
jgi:alpha-methylacyl-CoA racemase